MGDSGIITIKCDGMEKPAPNLNYKKVREKIYSEGSDKDVTIVVQAYGKVDKTRTCVDNILKHTNNDYDLLLMDNGTENQELLDYFKTVEYSKKNIIRFTKNITGVFAIDTTLKLLKTKYIVLVNNDVIVTHNWLDNLIACAESDNSIGMVVASSTNVSNLQYEDMGGFDTEDELHEKAKDFNISDSRKWEEKIRLIPTATLYRREIFDVVGLYDLGFMHDFGDDDFTFRVRRAGYKLMLCRDTFVHHNHDQSALPKERLDIMKHSREFFKEKHKGIDAWDDTTNFIKFSFNGIEDINNNSSILAIDVKCGTPILEMKNFCRKNEAELSFVKAYTSDAKYYVDLQSVSNDVACGNIESLLIEEKRKYDYIILGKPINVYSNPFELLNTLSSLLNKGGYIIFSVRNTNNVFSFLNMLNVNFNSDELQPRAINYREFITVLSDLNLTNAKINTYPLSISEELNEAIKRLLIRMNFDEDKSFVNNIMTQDYWITAH